MIILVSCSMQMTLSFWQREVLQDMLYILNNSRMVKNINQQGHVVQSVTCLTADMCLTADPGVAS